MSKKSNKTIYLAALLLFMGGLGYLIFSGISGASSYWIGVAEITGMPAEKPIAARVFGNVKVAGVVPQESGGIRFLLEDKENSAQAMWISYAGAIPEAFKPGAEVIVDGTYHGAGQDFKAHTLITSCPSKYEKKNRES